MIRIAATLLAAGWLTGCATVGAIVTVGAAVKGTADQAYTLYAELCPAANAIQDALQDRWPNSKVLARLADAGTKACDAAQSAPASVVSELDLAIVAGKALLGK